MRPTRIRVLKMKKLLTVFFASALFVCAYGQTSNYTRGSGWLLRPETGIFLNVGRQFNPHLSISVGPGFSAYGTENAKLKLDWALNGDVRYYMFDKKFTPMATLRVGTFSFSYFFAQALAGVTWKDWDFQVGYLFTPGMYTSGNISWSIGYNFRFYSHK